MHPLAPATGFQHARIVVRIALCLIHRLQRAIQSCELRREPALLLVELGVAARRLGPDGGWVKHVDRRAQLVGVAVGLIVIMITCGAPVSAENEAAEEWLHSHDAGAYDARVCLDKGPEIDSDAIVRPI